MGCAGLRTGRPGLRSAARWAAFVQHSAHGWRGMCVAGRWARLDTPPPGACPPQINTNFSSSAGELQRLIPIQRCAAGGPRPGGSLGARVGGGLALHAMTLHTLACAPLLLNF